MKKAYFSFVTLLFLGTAVMAHAQGTSLTYEGRLDVSGAPATGTYDLTFTLFDSSTNGNQQGNTVTNLATGVTNGLFTVIIDFGNEFPGAARWLEIGVRTNGGGTFSPLTPRQQFTSTPYAVQAANAVAASVAATASSVAAGNITGTLSTAQLPASVVTNGASGVNFSGTFSGNGAGVTNVLLSTLNTTGFITWPGNFTPSFSFSFSQKFLPSSVTTADVNGDGKVDLICADVNGGDLLVMTNNGTGNFALASSPVVGNGPSSVVAADVNGDGKLDLICANKNDNTLTVLTNNGSGGFVYAATLTVGTSPVSVVAADVNGDGTMDLICANQGDGTLTVLTNDGTGNFALASSPVVGTSPISVVAADVNGDGYKDLICAAGNTLTVLTNDGSGNFVLASSPAISSGFEGINELLAVTAADVNGDGKVDLICAGRDTRLKGAPGSLSVLLNAAAFHGNGSELTSLNASQLTTGLVPNSALQGEYSNSVDFNNTSDAFTGNGSGLSSLNASSLANGTVADARLSANVALRAGGNSFSGNQTVAGNVGIGTTTPNYPLDFGQSLGDKLVLWDDGNGQSYGFGIQGTQLQVHADNTASDIVFGTGSSTNLTESMRIKGSGRVGIGTTTPQQLLQVGNNSAVGSQGMIHLASRTSDALGNAARDWDIGVPQTGDSAVGIGYSFVIHDSGMAYPSQLLVQYGSGNIGIANTNPAHLLVVGNNASPAYCDGTTWANGSDRNAKKDFSPVNPEEVLAKVLALPITQWQYKATPGQEHLGPMAQDFHEAFGLNGDDDKHIATVDESGVAFSAIQGLNEKLEQQAKAKDEEIKELKQKNDSLAARLERLEKLVSKPESEHEH